MDVREMRKRCSQLVETLDLWVPFDLNLFCERLGTELGTNIDLLPQHLPSDAPGRLIWFVDRLIIAYEQETSLFHQQYIVFHEIGHLLLGHDLASTLQPAALRVSMDSEAIRKAFARGAYASHSEQEAEVVASVMAQKVSPTPIVASAARHIDPRGRTLEDFMAGIQ